MQRKWWFERKGKKFLCVRCRLTIFTWCRRRWWPNNEINGLCYEDGQCNKPCPGNDEGKSFSAGGVGGFNKKAGWSAGGFGGGGNCWGVGGGVVYYGGGVQVDGKSEDLDLSGAGGGGSFASYTPFAVHYAEIRNHLRKTATNSAKIHSLARKREHLCINQIQ